jgi:hypothetical protein
MLPLALTAALATSGPDLIDWAKATDDMRFALLKPVMTEKEVRRLFAGKEMSHQGCGYAKTETGEVVGASSSIYHYSLTGRKEEGCISFHHMYPNAAPAEADPEVWRGWNGQPAKPQPRRGILFAFRADEVMYKRTKDGLFEAQPAKK